ncbi:MAG: DUF1573 domain-containing protein [Bacteroidales bacterium]
MLKKVLIYSSFIFTIVLFANSCENQQKVNTEHVFNPATADNPTSKDNLPKIKFSDFSHDFGKVIQGEKVSYSFKFKNIGDSDLVINSVKTSCGCTVGKYKKDPIPPGGEGFISVTFDSENRRGYQNKTVRVIANTQPSTTILKIKSMVILPEEM